MKAGRQQTIIGLINESPVTSQNQLVQLLHRAGYSATQATVSRDLEDLGAIKVRREGKIAYALPVQVESIPIGETLGRLLSESVRAIESTGNLIVIRTPPGHAAMVAAAIDRASLEGIAGTIAGDDTIFVACKQGVMTRKVERRLRALAGAPELNVAQ